MANPDNFNAILRSIQEAVEPFTKFYDFRIVPATFGGMIEVRIDPVHDNPYIQIVPGDQIPVKIHFGPIYGWYSWKGTSDFADKILILSSIAHRAEEVCNEVHV